MIWLTWRQFRAQAWVTSAVLAVLAAVLAVTGLRLAHLYGTSGIAGCHAHADCTTVSQSFLEGLRSSPVYSSLFYGGIILLYATPGLLGIFWGAPLVTREIEAGTFRLAWNQSITRARWLAVKLTLTGLTAMAAAGLLSLMVTWWASPIQAAAPLAGPGRATSVISRFGPTLFATRGITPVGYAAFAFALGVTLGVLIRRTIPAMAATLAVFAGIQIAWPVWIRPHLMTPVSFSRALQPSAISGLQFGGHMTVFTNVNLPGAWTLSSNVLTPGGQPFTGPAPHTCSSPASGFDACAAALSRLHLRQLVSYQPASRYWPFQWYETGIFLALALVLTGLCVWWVQRRRLS